MQVTLLSYVLINSMLENNLLCSLHIQCYNNIYVLKAMYNQCKISLVIELLQENSIRTGNSLGTAHHQPQCFVKTAFRQ